MPKLFLKDPIQKTWNLPAPLPLCRHFSIVDEELRHSLMKQLIQNGGLHFNPSAFGERPTDREQF